MITLSISFKKEIKTHRSATPIFILFYFNIERKAKDSLRFASIIRLTLT